MARRFSLALWCYSLFFYSVARIESVVHSERKSSSEQVRIKDDFSTRHGDNDDEMKYARLATMAMMPLAAGVGAVNVVVSNDDGWAVSNIRSLYSALLDGGYDTILSAPAENQSGTGSKDSPPTEVEDGCEYDSCPRGSPPTGNNASDTRLNYVNSYPVTSMAYGIDTLAADFFSSGEPDIALSGPNHGTNLGVVTQFSGTVGAAVEAAKSGYPAVAFSGHGGAVPWNEPTPKYSQVYGELALMLTNELTKGEKPYLPDNTWLNVNFPEVSDECAAPEDFTFVLSRIYPSVPLVSDKDVETCGNGGRLLAERTISWMDGCYVTVSVGDLQKQDAGRDRQAAVLERLGDLLGCVE